MDYIFISSKDGINKVGVVENNRLVEFYTEEENDTKLVGNVYRGRVENVLRGMGAAFVNIGEGRNAYLYVKDAYNKEQLLSKKKYSIDQVIKSGQEVMVQVIKEPLGSKGPKVTTHISLPGRYVVLTPFSKDINISRKISKKSEIIRLKELGQRIIEDDIGMIFRTNAKDKDEDIIQAEYKQLLAIYRKIEMQKGFLPTPKRIYKELDLIYKIVRETFNERDYQIIVNNKEVYDNILELGYFYSIPVEKRIILDEGFCMEEHADIQNDLQQAFKRKVPLDNGGYIVIDETEALTAIDINTGKYTGNLSLKDTVLRTNLLAAEEIARQIRLRDIGGIIIIDFIDMKSKSDKSEVLSRLAKCFKLDRNQPNIIGITKLNLVEITRKKIRPTLDSTISITCPTCLGRGRIQK
ncbi:MAG: Rne/Rng family ribonuclease [Tissierellaceae bacterium]|jgi:ribonuclease G|nr:Rne/Rng family ribonuclease [Tissierellia bacterium]